ncbi:MAG: rhomboid family intramembrane serine protease [Allosphingosinicella sp.]
MQPPESWRKARVTLAIAALTALAFAAAWISGREGAVAVWGGFIPARWLGAQSTLPLAPAWLTPLTATLIHGGPLHLGFNLLIFLFCGRAVETIVGSRAFALLYLVGAYVAAAAQFALAPASVEPMIGASGAISAVIGAYALLVGRNKVKVTNRLVAGLLHALWLAVAWVALQYLIAWMLRVEGIEVAVGAHVGGFIAGLLLARPLLLWKWRGA